MKKLKIIKPYNTKNISNFEYGMNNPEENVFKCVLCDKDACIEDSFSNHGNKLICYRCVRTEFKSVLDALEWINDNE